MCGNGGSASMSQHFAGELVGKFREERVALPAIALTSDIATITAVANDYGYEYVFERQLQALAKPDDVLIILSTSGKSANCLKAAEWGKKTHMVVIDWPRLGTSVSSKQEYQLRLIHKTCELVERAFLWK